MGWVAVSRVEHCPCKDITPLAPRAIPRERASLVPDPSMAGWPATAAFCLRRHFSLKFSCRP